MIIQFTVGNFLSFKENKTISMLASPDKTNEEGAIFEVEKLKLLKSTAIYGSNSSGKSNLLQAMRYVDMFINTSSKEGQVNEKINWADSFKFNKETEKEPSFFEFVFILDKKRYRYGFEVNTKQICSEWLFEAKTIKRGVEKELFTRDKKGIYIKDFEEGKGLEQKTRNNALFISVSANFNGKKASSILKYFYNNFYVVSGHEDVDYGSYTIEMINEDKCKDKIKEMLNRSDVQISDFDIIFKKFKEKDAPKSMPTKVVKELLGKELPEKIYTFHKYFDGKKDAGQTKIEFKKESRGTQKIFNLSGLIIKFLASGGSLIVDELDTSLHPKMTEQLIKIFNSPKTNPNNAQLIFTTHDVNLLGLDFIRRDQIWFTEKDKYGASDLYSLLEYKPRKDASIKRGYMDGRYGAIPFVNFENFLVEKKDDCK